MPENRQTKSPFSLKRAFDLINGLKDRCKRVETEIKALKDLLNVHDNWPAAILAWKMKSVRVKDMDGEVAKGKLAWSDRYNFAVDVDDQPSKRRVYSKGGFIYLEGEK